VSAGQCRAELVILLQRQWVAEEEMLRRMLLSGREIGRVENRIEVGMGEERRDEGL
jgi:hypothetical protein